MPAVYPSFAKAEMFLIVVAALSLMGATMTVVLQYAAPVTQSETTATTEQVDPTRVPLPAGPRKFQ